MKLTNKIRDEVSVKIIKEKFDNEVNRLYNLFLESVKEQVKKEYSENLKFYEIAQEKGFQYLVKTEDNVRLQEGTETKYNLLPDGDSEYFVFRWKVPYGCVRIDISVPTEKSYLYIQYTEKIKESALDCIQKMREALGEYEDIRSVLYSCTTDKQLTELVPAFAKYLPASQVCTAIVPVETVNRVKNILFS